MSAYTLTLQTIASLTGIATTTSLIIAYRQWRLAARNSQLSFEDALAREYRHVAHRVPIKALLGDGLNADELQDALPAFYWYFDLTNEQVFLRKHRRVSDTTWSSWSEGIRRQMGRPAFVQAWLQIQRGPIGPFAELRRFAKSGFADDPAAWRSEPDRHQTADPLTRAPATQRQSAQPAQPATPRRRHLSRLLRDA